MAITDIALNPLLAPDASGQMLGFTEPDPAAEVLHLKMYNFLINPIRQADATSGQKGGNLFVKRFLDGMQAQWDAIQRRGFAVRDLWDVTRIDDEHLQYLKNIVGWTDQPVPKAITDQLTPTQLRKLIATAIALWRIRGTEGGYESIIRIVTDARLRILNWFDYRYLIEETTLGEDHQGRDPFIIPVDDENLSDIRIVDDGTLDRQLLLLMIQFFKPGGENVNVFWIDFLDLFNSAGGDGQWESVESGAPVVITGSYTLLDDSVVEEVTTNIENDTGWTDYLAYFRVRFTQTSGVSSVRFFYLGSIDFYKVEFDISANNMVLTVVVAGAPTVLDTYSFATHSQTLVENVYYGVRIVCENLSDPTETSISIWVDGNERMSVVTSVASRQTKGKLTARHEIGATIEISEVEMFQLPLEANQVGLNGAVT